MRKLVFNFFIDKGWRENSIYDIHFRCLEYYRDCFDEAYFALSLKDPEDVDSLIEVKQKLMNIFSNIKHIEFETVKNTPFCECPTFKKEIADKLGEDDLVFFGHLKGVYDLLYHDEKWVHEWICSLYYLSLNEEYKQYGFLDNGSKKDSFWFSYGSFLITFEHNNHTWSKHMWQYSGTFFWINSKRIKQYMDDNDIELPVMTNRYYAENFLGHIYPIQYCGCNLPCSYRDKFVIVPEGESYCEYTAQLSFIIETEQEKQEYNKFVEIITEK